MLVIVHYTGSKLLPCGSTFRRGPALCRLIRFNLSNTPTAIPSLPPWLLVCVMSDLPGAQPASRSSNTQLVPDRNVDRILDRVKSPPEEDRVRKLVEALEKVGRVHLLPISQRIQPVDDRYYGSIFE